jgi:acetyl esterase
MSEAITRSPIVLEPASQEFVEATSTPPFLYQLTPADARKVLDDVQAAPIDKLPVEDRWITVPTEVGDVRVRIVRPPDTAGTLPVILYMHGYMHGGGWVLGNADTHDRLVRELAVGTGAAVIPPPTESPATAMRSGSSWFARPSRTIHRAVAYPCSIATG